MERAASVELEPRRVVLGPAPCHACGAWIEWLGIGSWVSLGTDEPHGCEAFLRVQADSWVGWAPEMAREGAAWRTPEPEWLTGRLAVTLLLVAVGAALVAARWASGLL